MPLRWEVNCKFDAYLERKAAGVLKPAVAGASMCSNSRTALMIDAMPAAPPKWPMWPITVDMNAG